MKISKISIFFRHVLQFSASGFSKVNLVRVWTCHLVRKIIFGTLYDRKRSRWIAFFAVTKYIIEITMKACVATSP